jgi:hypothetical protein
MTFRHRHFRLGRLIETAEFLQRKQPGEEEDLDVPLSEIQWSRKDPLCQESKARKEEER